MLIPYWNILHLLRWSSWFETNTAIKIYLFVYLFLFVIEQLIATVETKGLIYSSSSSDRHKTNSTSFHIYAWTIFVSLLSALLTILFILNIILGTFFNLQTHSCWGWRVCSSWAVVQKPCSHTSSSSHHGEGIYLKSHHSFPVEKLVVHFVTP